MLSPIDIMNGITRKNHELNKKTMEYQHLIEKSLYLERDYHVALYKHMTLLKSKGETVTWINSVVKLEPEIAELRLAYHLADAEAKACLQSIKDCRCAIDSYRSLLAWEKAVKTEL